MSLTCARAPPPPEGWLAFVDVRTWVGTAYIQVYSGTHTEKKEPVRIM
jgi:hypothetical protein